MATLSTPERATLDIPLIRGDRRDIYMDINIDDVPANLIEYDIKMEVRDGTAGRLVAEMSGFDVNGNTMTLSFPDDSPVFDRDYKYLSYDISFTKDDMSRHWIKGRIIITNSDTVTWQTT